MVGSAAIKQGQSANRKHTYFWGALQEIGNHKSDSLLATTNYMDTDRTSHSVPSSLGL